MMLWVLINRTTPFYFERKVSYRGCDSQVYIYKKEKETKEIYKGTKIEVRKMQSTETGAVLQRKKSGMELSQK